MTNKSSENDQLTAFLLISPEEKNSKTSKVIYCKLNSLF